MTYRNAQRLWLGWVLLASSTLGSGPGTAAPAETAAPGKPAQAIPAAAPALRQKVAVSAPPKLGEQPAPAPVASISQDSRPSLDASTFINTMRAAWTYKRLAEAGGWPSLPAGTILKAGDKGPLVALLRQRLALEGDLPADAAASTLFDAELASAVKRFQARHGLPESGAVRARTLEAINVPALTRHRQLTASAQRLAGSTFAFGERYVVVNIPSAAVEAIERGEVARRYVAIVGKVDRPSPIVETRVTAVNLNPTWTVPVSLIKKDIIPHVRKDPAYLDKMKIRILDAKGQEVDPKSLDWSTETAVNYTLRQDPGAINSLGQIRIDMPNKHAVYMHDTPKKQLFAQDARFHSSGCVRVADVGDFAEWLLRSANGSSAAWTRDGIDAAIASSARQDIRLEKPVPVAWVYLTGYATADGAVHFREDVYGLDAPKSDVVPEPQMVDIPATASIKPKRL
jgi:murein L,D-transpeptidase YcbB/YkuD